MSSIGVDGFGRIATLPGRMVSGYLLERYPMVHWYGASDSNSDLRKVWSSDLI